MYVRHERFKNGREAVEDDECGGKSPLTSKTDENVDKIQKMVRNNRKLTIRETAEYMNIAYGTVRKKHVGLNRGEGDAHGFHWTLWTLDRRSDIELLTEGQTVNKEYYLAVMKRLRDAISRERPDLWALHHDYAPSHNAILVGSFRLKTKRIRIWSANHRIWLSVTFSVRSTQQTAPRNTIQQPRGDNGKIDGGPFGHTQIRI